MRRRHRLRRFLLFPLLGVLLAAGPLGAARADVEDDPGVQRMRVMGGSDARPGEFPSMVSIQIRGPRLGSREGHHCGGTVIAAQWVLTAAHCVVLTEGGRSLRVPPAALVVAEGREDHRLLRPDALRLVDVEAIIVHPAYREIMRRLPNGQDGLVGLANDVALLRLREPSNRPAQLLAGSSDRAALETPGRGATVIGFGQTVHQGPSSEALLRGSIPIVAMGNCIAPRRPLPPDVERAFISSQLCAGNRSGSTDACQGDSGGPLFVLGRGQRVVQVGVVSQGPPCRVPLAGYGGYASVAAANDFIRQHVQGVEFTANEGSAGEPERPAPAPGPRPPEELNGAADTPRPVPPGVVGQVSIDIREGLRLPVGSRASFRISSSVTGLLMVLARNPRGEVVQLFPNNRMAGFQAGQARPVIEAGQTIRLPGPADGFQAVVQPPLGEAVAIAVVLPRNAANEALAGLHIGLRPIPDPQRFLADIEAQINVARSMTPEALPTNMALGFRRFTVVAP